MISRRNPSPEPPDDGWLHEVLSGALAPGDEVMPDDVRARIDRVLETEQQLRLERVEPTEDDPYAEVDAFHWGTFGVNLPTHYDKQGLGIRSTRPSRSVDA